MLEVYRKKKYVKYVAIYFVGNKEFIAPEISHPLKWVIQRRPVLPSSSILSGLLKPTSP
jgi:hypothetical protein